MHNLRLLKISFSILCASFLASICHAALDYDQLSDVLTEVLTNSVKDVPQVNVIHDADKIATASASAVTNFQSLYTSLTNQLGATKELNLSMSRAQILAQDVAGYFYNGVPLPPRVTGMTSKQLMLKQRMDTNETNRWRFNFSTGAEFLNPYVVNVASGAVPPQTGFLNNAGRGTVPYFQLELTRRWVDAPTYADIENPKSRAQPRDDFFPIAAYDALKNGLGEADWTPDLDVQIGFLVGNNTGSSGGSNTYSASTLAGSDIYLQGATGLPIWRNWVGYDYPCQLSLGLSGGLTTDEQFEKIHPKAFVGGLLDFGLPFLSTNTLTPGLIEIKGGAGYLDNPVLTGTTNQVQLNSYGLPQFKDKWAPEVGARALIPIVNGIYLDVETDAYFSRPNQWDVKVGATIPFSTIQKMLPFLNTGGS